MERAPSGEASRPRGRPRSEEARAAILDAAIALTREVGFDALAMEAVAARAGVGKGTIYRWWPSKEVLVAEAVGGIVQAIPVPETGRLEDDVLQLMHAAVRMYGDPATSLLLSALVAAMARSATVADAVRGGMLARWRGTMREVLRRGVTRGELRSDVDLDLVIDLLSGPGFYRFLMGGRPVHPQFTRAVVVAVLGAFAPALRGRTPPAIHPGPRRR